MNQERIFQVIRAPHISEKATVLADKNRQFVFKVAIDATRPEIKQAIEELFKVKVKGVQVLNVKGKTKRTNHGVGRKSTWRKAYVSLQDGFDIDFAS